MTTRAAGAAMALGLSLSLGPLPTVSVGATASAVVPPQQVSAAPIAPAVPAAAPAAAVTLLKTAPGQQPDLHRFTFQVRGADPATPTTTFEFTVESPATRIDSIEIWKNRAIVIAGTVAPPTRVLTLARVRDGAILRSLVCIDLHVSLEDGNITYTDPATPTPRPSVIKLGSPLGLPPPSIADGTLRMLSSPEPRQHQQAYFVVGRHPELRRNPAIVDKLLQDLRRNNREMPDGTPLPVEDTIETNKMRYPLLMPLLNALTDVSDPGVLEELARTRHHNVPTILARQGDRALPALHKVWLASASPDAKEPAAWQYAERLQTLDTLNLLLNPPAGSQTTTAISSSQPTVHAILQDALDHPGDFRILTVAMGIVARAPDPAWSNDIRVMAENDDAVMARGIVDFNQIAAVKASARALVNHSVSVPLEHPQP